MKIAVIATAVVNLLVIFSLPLTLKLYSLSEDALRLARTLIIIHTGFAIILWPSSFVLPNALKAAGDVRFTIIISIFSMITLRILFSYILGVRFGMGAIGVWISMIMDWIFRAVSFIIRFKSGKWLRGSLV